MALVIEDSEKTLKKRIPIPKNTKEVFKAMKKLYEPYLDKVEGGHVLKSYASDKTYNKKKPNANGNPNKTSSVGVDDAKMRLHRQEKFSPNSIQYQLYGGTLAHNLLKKGVENARNVGEVDAVKPPKPTGNSKIKTSDVKTKEVSKPNGKITFSVKNEGKETNRKIIYINEGQALLLKED